MTDIAEQIESAKFYLTQKGELSGCTSYIQRKLECGFNRAAAILEALEHQGFISEPDDKGRRRLQTGAISPHE
jgi:DNA segregation ATPase FtsK/SpoIIIE-like protein